MFDSQGHVSMRGESSGLMVHDPSLHYLTRKSELAFSRWTQHKKDASPVS